MTELQIVPLGIDINGLDGAHQKRIQEVGLDAWMDEQSRAVTQPTVRATASKPVENLTRHRRECVGCGRTFYSKRSDARYHSPACRVKGHRRGQDVTLKPLSSTSNQRLAN
jgi:hypothetical protein